ncbi:MAG: rhodanese-like domain-containing protein [Ruminiclostridium sp.]|nr:rhodanese-like domain-containing protein [Ruminiclostridium sp.]
MYYIIPIVLIVLIVLLVGGCALNGQLLDGDGMVDSYATISQEEAQKMMQVDDGHIILDVRRQDEFDEEHIPGAICIPNESITDTQPEELPDLHQVILVYCRSGRRSKEAAQKLFDMGYTHVFEFGGIIDWTGETVKSEGM